MTAFPPIVLRSMYLQMILLYTVLDAMAEDEEA